MDKIYFDLFSEDHQEFTAKHHAFAVAAVANELHRSHCYKVRMNSDPNYPTIDTILEEVSLVVGDAHAAAYPQDMP